MLRLVGHCCYDQYLDSHNVSSWPDGNNDRLRRNDSDTDANTNPDHDPNHNHNHNRFRISESVSGEFEMAKHISKITTPWMLDGLMSSGC